MILLDTSVLSRVFRRARVGPQEREIVAAFETLLQDDEPLGLPGIVLQEALSGLRADRAFRDLRSKLLGAFTILPASVADHLEAARIRNQCATKGTNASGIDCLIAATAILGEHELFAVDADFEAIRKVSGLRLYRGRATG